MLRKLDLHHLPFLHFHLYPLSLLPAPCHTRNLSVLLSALSLSLFLSFCLTRRFFPAVRPIPRIFAYFIIYGTMRPRGREHCEFCEFQHAEETYLEECYDLRANEVDSFAFLFFFSPSFRPFFFFLFFFNYSLQVSSFRHSDLSFPLLSLTALLLAVHPVCFLGGNRRERKITTTWV